MSSKIEKLRPGWMGILEVCDNEKGMLRKESKHEMWRETERITESGGGAESCVALYT